MKKKRLKNQKQALSPRLNVHTLGWQLNEYINVPANDTVDYQFIDS